MARKKKTRKESLSFSTSITPRSLKEELDPSPIVRSLRAKNSQLEKEITKLKLEFGDFSEFFDELVEATTAIDPINLVYKKSKKKKIVESPVTAVASFGDWHIGEVTEPDQIECFNEFNWKIANRRVAHYCDKFLGWVEIHRSSYQIDELVILVLGDMVSGDIHEELRRHNEFATPVQCCNAGHLLSESIASMAPYFSKIRVEFIVADNHGRLTQKFQYKGGGYNSFNYIVGWIARERLANLPNVEFNLYPHLKAIVGVQNQKYLCSHGSNIRGWAGFPWYGADRITSKEAKSRMFTDKQFHRMVIGHFHVPLNTQYYLVNGSLSGTSEFDQGAGRHCKPCQTAWMVHPKHAEFDWTCFWLDNV